MRESFLKRKVVSLTLAVMLSTFSLAEVVFAQATVFTTHEFEPFSDIVEIPCANGGSGEVVLISGILHIQTHVTVNGSRSNRKRQLNLREVTGVGIITGDVYHGTGTVKLNENGPFSSEAGAGADLFTFAENFRMFGPDIHFQMHRNIHQTINANGEVTSTVDTPFVVCN